MAPHKLKLLYFDTRGRGEILRLLFAAAGKAYDDVRLTQEAWGSEKANTPFGQLPCLEIDGVRYGQTVALANYLAREFGLYGKTNLDSLKIDQVIQLAQDFVAAIIKAAFEPDESKKADAMKNLKEVEVPKYLSFFEVLLVKNGGGHFVGSSLTLADVVVYDIVDTSKTRGFGTVDAYPAIQQLVKNVESNDGIKAYLATRTTLGK